MANIPYSRERTGQTSGVGLFADGESLFGVLDMSGNVWEWCLNDYHNPEVTVGYSNTNGKVLRGGSFSHDAYGAAAAYRRIELPHPALRQHPHWSAVGCGAHEPLPLKGLCACSQKWW